jgi:hypothetical protein
MDSLFWEAYVVDNLPQYMQYAAAFIWGLALLASFSGWGKALLATVQSPVPRNWGREAAYGLCVAVLYGGILNLTHLVSTQTIVGFVIAGCLYWVRCTSARWQRSTLARGWAVIVPRSKSGLLFLAVVTLWALFKYGGSVWGYATGFNPEDDFKGYFVLMERMLQEGYLPADPLNARRLLGGLGGHDFLNTMGVSVLSTSNMNLLEPGVVTLIAVGVLVGNGAGTSPSSLRYAPALMLLAIPLPLRNVTSMVDGIALLLALYAVISRRIDQDGLTRGDQIIAGLLVATLCTLRNTYVSQLGVILAMHYVHLFIVSSNRHLVVKEAISVGCSSMLFVSPWAIASLVENGTLLYPYTGSGRIALVEGMSIASATSSYGFDRMLEAFMATIGHPLLICSLIVLLCSVGVRRWKGSNGAVYPVFCLSLLLSSIITEVGTARFDPNFRYSFPLLCTAYLVCLQECLAGSRAAGIDIRRGRLSLAIALTVSCTYVALGATAVATSLNYSLIRIVGGNLYGDTTFAQERRSIRQMQSLVPSDGTLLAAIDMPFSLDYRAGKVLTTDYPGLCGFGVPMPVSAGVDTLRGYLNALGVTHFALGYYPPAEQVDNEYSKSSHPLIRLGRSMKKSFHSVALLLVGQSEIVYNDGRRVLVAIDPSLGKPELPEGDILEYLRSTADTGKESPSDAIAVTGLFRDLWFSKSMSVTFPALQGLSHAFVFESIGPATLYPLQLQLRRHDSGEIETLTVMEPGRHLLEFTTSAVADASTVNIDISCNKSFIPAQISAGNADIRELSMRLVRIDELDLNNLDEHIMADRLIVGH